MEKRILALDSQILDAIQKCPFYCYLNFYRNYRTNDKIEPLERGDLGHTILEEYYKLLQAGIAWDEAVDKATEKGRNHYMTLSLDFQVSEWVIKTFHQYSEYYRHDGIQILGIEETFSFVLYEDDELIVLYEGKIDLHAGFPNIGPTVLDHKFRAMKADYSPLDNQLIGYATSTNSNLAYINEVGLQKSYEPEKKFRRVPIFIGEGVKERWKKNTIMWAKILDHAIQNNVWPQSHLKTAPLGITQCVKCQDQVICNSETEEEMNRKIQDHFHQGEKWDVGKKNETATESGK